MNEGKTVSHAEFGRGTVIEDDPHRRRVRVDFGWMQDWVSYNEAGLRDLRVVEARPADTTRPGGLPNDVVDSRRAILALKLGQVLKENVVELSTGTDEIQKVLEEKAEATTRGQPGSILFEGSWGSGKTHLLTLLAALATERRLATASVILDGEGVRLSEPMSLMRSVLGSLCYSDELVPGSVIERLREFRRRRSGSRAEIQRGASWRTRTAVFKTPMRAFDEPEVADILDEYLTMSIPATQARERLRKLGHSVQLPSMNARRVDERVERFCELLGGWAEICTLTGAKGLVVVFDEVDVEYGSTLGRSRVNVERRRLRSALLEALWRLLNPKRHMPLLIAFGSAPPRTTLAKPTTRFSISGAQSVALLRSRRRRRIWRKPGSSVDACSTCICARTRFRMARLAVTNSNSASMTSHWSTNEALIAYPGHSCAEPSNGLILFRAEAMEIHMRNWHEGHNDR